MPADRLVGSIEQPGLKHALAGLELGRINVAARGVGIAQAALEQSRRYAQLRKTFGKPIAQHQAIQHVAGVLTSAFVTGEGRVWSYEHPHHPGFRMVPPAFRLPGEPVPRRAAPALGADTDTVLNELGYSKQRIAALRRGGTI